MSVLLTQRSRIPRVMDLVRHLTLLTLRFNFCIRAEHIEGKRNDIADSLSSLSDGSVQGASTPYQPRSMSGPTRTPEDLMADIQRYLSLSVADSTKQTYSTGGGGGGGVLSSSSPSIDLCMLSLY